VQSSAPAQPSAHWVVVSEAAAVRPPANVTALARDLGVDTYFAWRTLDELVTEARSTPAGARPLVRGDRPSVPSRSG
jgi:hypothetical protein